MKRYPNFNQYEWNQLSPDLYVVTFWKELTDTENKLRALQDQKNQILAQYGTFGESLLTYIQDDILQQTGTEQDEETRLKVMHDIVENLRKQYGRPNKTAAVEREIEKNIRNLYWFYAKFNLDQFIEDFNKVYGEETSGDESLDEKKRKVNGSIGWYTGVLNTLRNKKIYKCFKKGVLPTTFRHFMVTENQEAVDVAESMIRCFVNDYKKRAPLFDRPVTISGVAINTLPKRKRETWQWAYEELGLDQLKRVPRYHWIKSKEKDPIVPVEQQESLLGEEEGD